MENDGMLKKVRKWSSRRDLNPRPADYKSAAIATKPRKLERGNKTLTKVVLKHYLNKLIIFSHLIGDNGHTQRSKLRIGMQGFYNSLNQVALDYIHIELF